MFQWQLDSAVRGLGGSPARQAALAPPEALPKYPPLALPDCRRSLRANLAGGCSEPRQPEHEDLQATPRGRQLPPPIRGLLVPALPAGTLSGCRNPTSKRPLTLRAVKVETGTGNLNAVRKRRPDFRRGSMRFVCAAFQTTATHHKGNYDKKPLLNFWQGRQISIASIVETFAGRVKKLAAVCSGQKLGRVSLGPGHKEPHQFGTVTPRNRQSAARVLARCGSGSD